MPHDKPPHAAGWCTQLDCAYCSDTAVHKCKRVVCDTRRAYRYIRLGLHMPFGFVRQAYTANDKVMDDMKNAAPR